MSADPHAIVDQMPTASPWRLDAGAVRERLHELVDQPGRLRQGRLNLCGPASVLMLWLTRDPVAAVTFAASLWSHGRGRLGSLEVQPGPGLYTARPPDSVAAADFLLMASLRDSANRVLPYRVGGLREPPAAITLPGTVRRWLLATGLYAAVRDETNLALPKPLGHTAGLDDPTGDILLLVAQEMLRQPWTVKHRVRSLLPNHWIVLRSPVILDGDAVRLRLWTWGATYEAAIPRARFARCYYGAVVGSVPPR